MSDQPTVDSVPVPDTDGLSEAEQRVVMLVEAITAAAKRWGWIRQDIERLSGPDCLGLLEHPPTPVQRWTARLDSRNGGSLVCLYDGGVFADCVVIRPDEAAVSFVAHVNAPTTEAVVR